MGKIGEQVEAKRRSIWEKEPIEVRSVLTKSKGTIEESFFPAIYATEGSRNVHLMVMTLRKVVLASNSDIETIKMVLKSYLESAVPLTFTWYGMTDTGGFLESIISQIDAVQTRKELLTLVEELAFYVGRLNYWLDGGMPWYELVETYEKVKPTL